MPDRRRIIIIVKGLFKCNYVLSLLYVFTLFDVICVLSLRFYAVCVIGRMAVEINRFIVFDLHQELQLLMYAYGGLPQCLQVLTSVVT